MYRCPNFLPSNPVNRDIIPVLTMTIETIRAARSLKPTPVRAGKWAYAQTPNIQRESRVAIMYKKAIDAADYITDLNDNWDDEGAIGYSHETWCRVVTFMNEIANCADQTMTYNIPAPSLGPADDGSIDLYWETEFCQLLVNIPRSASESAAFSYESSGVTTDGEFNTDSHSANWLVKLLQ